MTNSPSLSRFSALLPQALLELSRRNPDDPLLFAQAHRRFGGRPMEIPPALHAIYREEHPFVVVQKPSQVGLTEFNVNYAMWAAATHQGGRGSVLYLMPTQENADRLSQRRIAMALRESPTLTTLAFTKEEKTPWVQRVKMRSFGPGIVYLTGSEEVTQYTGIDADVVILDEYDEMSNDEILAHAMGRLRSSTFARMRVTSTPTIPESGINGLLAESDERHYELHCPACGTWVDPHFPENVDFALNAVVCVCGSPLDPLGEGRWVALRPEISGIRGYALNRLVLPKPPLTSMRLAASGTIGMRQEQFWRLDLGLPFVAADARLSAEDLDACRTGDVPAPEDVKAVVMGVDVAGDCFWVVVRAFANKRSYLLFADRVPGGWEALHGLRQRFKVEFCVVDALPDTRGAGRFQREALSASPMTYAWRCYYRHTGMAHERDWGFEGKISAVRTLALDETFDGFRQQQSLLPLDARQLAGGAYYRHLQALVRTTQPDEFGQPLPAYVHTRPDEFAHAENYVTLVATWLGRSNGWWP